MKHKRKKKRRLPLIYRVGIVFAAVIGVILLLGLAAVAAYLWMTGSGKSRFEKKQQAVPEQMQQETFAEEDTQLEAGSIRYKGKTYTYKKDILTFLVMGIDKKGEVEASSDLFKGGQADALFLAALDQKAKEISVVGINRDTMTQIKIFDENGLSAGTETAQIALSHAYGDGLEESCENTVEAVSNLLYGLPIHGYCALNMSVISTVNDAIGGVDVVIPESAVGIQKGGQAGETVRLEGKAAYDFIHYRDVKQAQSAKARLERQKQYLKNFVAQAKSAMKQNMMLPLQLYAEITPYMVTNVTADGAVYLAGEALSYQFGEDSIYSMEGTVEMGEQFEEFYPDETALYEMALDVFYEQSAQE